MPLRLSFYGGPGCSKSTTAAIVFGELKKRHYIVELVSEAIKSWAWLKRTPQSWDQFYLFGKQLHAEDIVLRHDAHIVTDSPLAMQIAYMERDGSPFVKQCGELVSKFDEKHKPINIFLDRTVDYREEGRWESLHQAREMDERVLAVLDKFYPNDYMRFDPLDQKLLLQYVLDKLQE